MIVTVSFVKNTYTGHFFGSKARHDSNFSGLPSVVTGMNNVYLTPGDGHIGRVILNSTNLLLQYCAKHAPSPKPLPLLKAETGMAALY